MKTGYLKKDQKGSPKGGRVDAWRIVDAAGCDIVQTWSRTRAEAMKLAEELKIQLSNPDKSLGKDLRLKRYQELQELLRQLKDLGGIGGYRDMEIAGFFRGRSIQAKYTATRIMVFIDGAPDPRTFEQVLEDLK